jgi:hypothetical protein
MFKTDNYEISDFNAFNTTWNSEKNKLRLGIPSWTAFQLGIPCQKFSRAPTWRSWVDLVYVWVPSCPGWPFKTSFLSRITFFFLRFPSCLGRTDVGSQRFPEFPVVLNVVLTLANTLDFLTHLKSLTRPTLCPLYSINPDSYSFGLQYNTIGYNTMLISNPTDISFIELTTLSSVLLKIFIYWKYTVLWSIVFTPLC